jgi:hypothetical protein
MRCLYSRIEVLLVAALTPLAFPNIGRFATPDLGFMM